MGKSDTRIEDWFDERMRTKIPDIDDKHDIASQLNMIHMSESLGKA